MTDSDDSELVLIEALEGIQTMEPEQQPDLRPRPAEAVETFEALRNAKGVAALVARFPHLERPDLWLTTAYCSVCELTGTAKAVRIAGEPGAQISDGVIFFGRIAPPVSSRLYCDFSAPSEGPYVLNVRMGNWVGPIRATVEALIDSKSFGQVQLSTGAINKAFTARLGKRDHSFELREVSTGGPSFFTSLTVWAVPVFKES